MKRKISLFIAVIMIVLSFNPVLASEIDNEKFEEDLDFMKNVIYFVVDTPFLVIVRL